MTKISFCASKFNTGPGEWNYENLLRYLVKYSEMQFCSFVKDQQTGTNTRRDKSGDTLIV